MIETTPGQHDKLTVIRLLHELAILLKLKGENRFRAQAYELGARAVEALWQALGIDNIATLCRALDE